MTKNPRVLVDRFEVRPNTNPESAKLWPECSTAILACGHQINLGVGIAYRPKRMACAVG